MKVWITQVILQGSRSPLIACSTSYQWQVLCKTCQHPTDSVPFSVMTCLCSLFDQKEPMFSHSVTSNSLQPMNYSIPGFPVHHQFLSLLKLMSTESVMPSNHLILRHPLLLPPSIFPSIRVFSSESVLHIRWPKYWSFSFSINPSSEYSGLISSRTDWLDLLAVQGTLKSLFQHHNWKA